MKRKPLITWFPFRFAIVIAPLMAAWPQRAQAGDWVFDNAGTAIASGATTTVNWTAANVWNPDGNNPGAGADGVWANAILNASGLPGTAAANTILNIDLQGNSKSINSFMQTGQNGTNPDNVTTNIVGTAGTTLTLNEIFKRQGGTLQFGANLELIAAVDAGRNPNGDLRVLNTDNSALQLQGKVTTPGDLIKDGSGAMRLGTTTTAFNNAISGNIIVNNGSIEFATNATFNPAGGAGRAVVMNAPNATINFRPQASFNFVREIDLHNDTTFSADRSAGTNVTQTVSTGTINVNADDKYLTLNSGNTFSYSFAGINLGARTLNIRNGTNNTAAIASSIGTGVLTGSGTIHVSGSGNNNNGLNFNTASPNFSGTVNLFEANNHTISATGALGRGTIVLGTNGNVLPITYPNQAVGTLSTPTVRSDPWWAGLNYNANNPTSAPVAVTANAGSQVNMGVVPGAGDVIQLNRFGIVQGSSAELAGFTVGGNLLLNRDSIVSHEVLGGSDPASIGTTPLYYHGLSANLDGAVTIGSGTPWAGLSNDRTSRNLGGTAATVITVNGGDNNDKTVEAALVGMNSGTFGVMKDTTGLIAGGTWASGSPGDKFTLAIRGQSNTFGGLGAGNQPGGTVQFFSTAAAAGLSPAVVDKIIVESGNLQLSTASGLGGVPVEVLNGGGLDIANAASIDGAVTFRGGSSLMLNDNFTLAGTGALTFDSGAKLHLVGNNPLIAADWTTWAQPINLPGANNNYLVRVGIDNIANLDTNVPDSGAIWEIAASGAGTTSSPLGTNLTGVQTITQTAGITTDGGIITNDAGGSRSLVGPVNIGPRGATLAATTGTSLVLMNPVNAGTTTPIQVGSLTPVDGVMKTGNPLVLSTNSNDPVSYQNGNPQVILEGGLKSGSVNLVAGNLALDGPAANTKITGNLTMSDNTVLYLGGGGNINTGTVSTGAGPFRGDLTPLLVAAPGNNVTTGSIILGNRSRVEMSLDDTYPEWTASLVGGRAQINQAFVVTGDLNPTDRRTLWVDRGAATTVLSADLNDITVQPNAVVSVQESNTDVRVSLKLQGNATFMGTTGGVDLKNVANVSAGAVTLNLGRADLAYTSTGLYGNVAAGVTFNNVNSRLEVRDGAVLDNGFIFNDNADSRAIMARQNTSQGGPNAGSDHTLSIFQGSTGAPATYLPNGTFNLNKASNAFAGYIDDSAAGSPLVNTIGSRINLNAAGGVLFSARNGADAAVNGVVRFADVRVNTANATLATRDLTDLEVSTLTVTQNAVIKVDGARTDSAVSATGAVRIGNVAAGANSVHFQDGRTSVTGNVTSGALTVGGTSMEFNPGTAGTSTVNASSVTVNTLLAAKSGTTNFGSTTITGTAVSTTVAGLREGRITGGAIDLATANPASSAAGANGYSNTNLGIRLDPRVAQNNFSGGLNVDTARGWSDNETWVYTGQVFVDAGGKLSLAENIDDNVDIRIDGTRLLNTNLPSGGAGQANVAPFSGFNTVTNTSTKDGLNQGVWQPNTVINNTAEGDIGQGLANTTRANVNEWGGTNTFTPGWHDIEIRLHNGTGGAGSPTSLGWGNYFGLGLSATGSTSFFGTDYTKPIDDGGMSLFRTTTVAKGNVDVDNSSVLSAGSIKTIGSLTYGRSGASGVSSVILTAAATGDVDSIDVLASADGGSKLDVTAALGKLVTQQFNLEDAKTFQINGGGGSAGELEIMAGATVTANPLAAITLSGGTLRLSNPTGTATGNAPITINGGTLAGGGITSSSVALNTGFISPGNSPGLLTTGNVTTTGGAYLLDIAGTSLAANGALYDTLNINGTVDLGTGVTALTLNLTYAPSIGDAFWPVLNDGLDPIVGFFAGLPEGGTLVSGPYSFQITYLADGSVTGPSSLTGGNDVALVAVPETSSAALLGLATIFTLRRRRKQA